MRSLRRAQTNELFTIRNTELNLMSHSRTQQVKDMSNKLYMIPMLLNNGFNNRHGLGRLGSPCHAS